MVTIIGVSGQPSQSSIFYHVHVVRMKVVQRVEMAHSPFGEKIRVRSEDMLGQRLIVMDGADQSLFPHDLVFYTNLDGRVCIAPIPSRKTKDIIADNIDLFQEPMKVDDLFRLLEFME